MEKALDAMRKHLGVIAALPMRDGTRAGDVYDGVTRLKSGTVERHRVIDEASALGFVFWVLRHADGAASELVTPKSPPDV